jgi:integrase
MNSYSVTVELRTDKKDKNGLCPVFIRVIVEKTQCQIATGMKFKMEEWDKGNNRLKSNPEKNLVLDSKRIDIEKIIARFEILKEPYDAQTVKNSFLGIDRPKITFLQAIEKHVKASEDGQTPDTKRKWKNYSNRMKRFFQEVYGKNDMLLSEVSMETGEELKAYLLKHFHNTSPAKIFSAIKGVLPFAVAKGWISADWWNTLKLKRPAQADPVSLNWEQVQRLQSWIAPEPYLEKARDMMLFLIFTGMSYIDAKNLKASDIDTVEGVKFIQKYRQKSNKQKKLLFCVPVFPETQAILDKYGFPLPITSNGNFNSYLKLIDKFCEFGVELSTKHARSTFVNLCLNQWGFSPEATSKMAGHSLRVMEGHYGSIHQKRIATELKSLILKKNNSEDSLDEPSTQ